MGFTLQGLGVAYHPPLPLQWCRKSFCTRHNVFMKFLGFVGEDVTKVTNPKLTSGSLGQTHMGTTAPVPLPGTDGN